MSHSRRKWTGRLLTGFTWILVACHLIPIAWMVYCGVKDNGEILQGKVLPGRRGNEIVFLARVQDGFLAGTADGGVTRFDANLKQTAHLELSTFATSFWLDAAQADKPGTLWALSSNRGLQEVDAGRLTLRKTYGIESMAAAYGDAWSTLWVNEVSGSGIYRLGTSLYLSYQFKGFPGVTLFDPATGTFKPAAGFPGKDAGILRGFARPDTGDSRLAVFTSQGVFLHSPDGSKPDKALRAGRLPAVPDRVSPLDDRRLLLSADSRAFIYDIGADSVLAWLERKEGSGIITAFGRSAGRIWLGDSRGATSIPDLYPIAVPTAPDAPKSAVIGTRSAPKTSRGAVPAPSPQVSVAAPAADTQTIEFRPRFPQVPGRTEDITAHRVTAILPLADGGALLGGPNGTLSLLDAKGVPIAEAAAPLPALYIHWRNYVDLWRNIDFGLYLKNSFIVCLGVMLVAMVLASMGGYALARFNFPGKNLFGYSVLATQMVPGIMLLLPLYLMFINFSRATGLIVKGTYGGLILTYAAYFVPFSIWILRGFFASLPKELEEAALVDGCGPLQAFFRIIIPSALPGIIATGVYVFLSAWDELMFAWVLTDEKTYTIPVGIRLFVGNFQNRYDLMMAAATVSTIPVMVLFFIMQRHIVSGLTAGAVKE
jgi:multiple sugar transport system permease protein